MADYEARTVGGYTLSAFACGKHGFDVGGLDQLDNILSDMSTTFCQFTRKLERDSESVSIAEVYIFML